MNSTFHFINKVLARNKTHGLQVIKEQILSSKKFLHYHHVARKKNLLSLHACSTCSLYLRSSIPLKNKSTSSTKRKLELRMNEKDEENEVAQAESPLETVKVGGADGWLTIGQYNVFAWSVSGVETCVVIKSEDVHVAFDLGAAISESVKVKDIFITHGHLDHIGAVSSHVSKRCIFNLKPGRYFVPPHLVDNLLTVTRAHHQMSEVEDLANVNVIPFPGGDSVRLNSRYFVKTFPTVHRVLSQGYIVYREQKKLKKEFQGRKGFEIAALHREGTEIHDICVTPEIAYTGDTTFEVFANPPTPDLLKVKLLITEATYLENDIGKNTVKKARERGHCHLSEFSENQHLFADVGHIILMHFSNKYSPNQIKHHLRSLPKDLKDKVSPAVVAKATTPQTFL